MVTKVTSLIFIVVVGSQLLFAGCPLPWSHSSVGTPDVIQDGSGGAIIAYQINEDNDRTTYIQRLGPQGDALWGDKGVVLYSESASEGSVEKAAWMASDGTGGAIVVFGQIDGLRAQRIDSDGVFLWEGSGIQLFSGDIGNIRPTVAGDNYGGAIIAWSTSHDAIQLQRLDSEGNLLWSGVPIVHDVHSLDLAVDTSGSALLVWEDKRFSIYTQKLGPNGRPQWTDGGLLISENGDCVMHGITGDGAEGAIVVWVHGIRDENGIEIIGQLFYAQRIDVGGNILWQTGGVPVCAETQGRTINLVFEPLAIEDELGGAIILWRAPMSIYAQRINADGDILWGEEGAQVWDAEGPQSPYYAMTEDGNGGAIIVWWYVPEGNKVDRNPVLRAQRLRANGEKLWVDNGVRLSTVRWGYCTPPVIASDGYGGAIVSWAAGENIHNAHSSYVQIIDLSGNLLLGENGIKLNP